MSNEGKVGAFVIAGLAVIDAPAVAGALARYPQLPAVRGELLARAGRSEPAAEEFRRAAGLTANDRERALYLARAAQLSP